MSLNFFDVLEKRRHVNKYDMNKTVPREFVEKALYKAWKTTPSKNQAMPYKVKVWGPKKVLQKVAIHDLCMQGHDQNEVQAVLHGEQKTTQRQNPGHGFPNPKYYHVKENPYLFTIHARLSQPNEYYQERIKHHNHNYDQGKERLIEHNMDSTALEVGIFVANLGYYLLEQGLDVSYNSCFARNALEWNKRGLEEVNMRCIHIMSCGYGEWYNEDVLKMNNNLEKDIKPPIGDIIEWI